MPKYKLITIGIDQSYTRTGISIAADNKIIKSLSLDFKGLETKSDKRKHLADTLSKVLNKTSRMALQTIIITERIRTFSNDGKGKGKGGFGGLKPDYIKVTGALVGRIVDTASDYNVPVYSVDTRSWKAQIIGKSKAKIGKDGKRDAKSDTVNFVQNHLKIDLFVRTNKNGKDLYDDDRGDAICISLYGFLPKSKQSLKLEE